MKVSPRTNSPHTHDGDPISRRSKRARRNFRRPYLKPRVAQAGSVFSRTKALGSGTKDIINGSAFL